RSSLRRLAFGRGFVRGSRFLLDHPHREDRQLVEAHERDRERQLAQHIGRREDGRDDEGADNEIAALLLELLRGDDATRPSSVRITGSWNAMPNAKVRPIMSERYSPTLGSSAISALPSPGSCCMPSEKRTSIGMTRKYTTIEPNPKKTGVAIRYGRKARRSLRVGPGPPKNDSARTHTRNAEKAAPQNPSLGQGMKQSDECREEILDR